MKKKMIKKLVALLISTLTLCTLFANAVMADGILPAYDDETVVYSMAGPAVAREVNEDGTEMILVGTVSVPMAEKKHHARNHAAVTNNTIACAMTETAAIGTDSALAVMDPSHHRNDIDLDRPQTVRDKIDQAGDILLDIASNFVPYGGSIMNYIKSHSKKNEPSTGTETVINVITDVATEVLPAIAEPVVTIASGIVTTVVKWIFY